MGNLSAAASLQKTNSSFLVAPIANSSSVGVGLHGHLPTPHLCLASSCTGLVQAVPTVVSSYKHLLCCISTLVLLIFLPLFFDMFPEPWEDVERNRCPSSAKSMQSLILWALTGFRSLFIVTPVLDLTTAYVQFWSVWFEMIPKNYT